MSWTVTTIKQNKQVFWLAQHSLSAPFPLQWDANCFKYAYSGGTAQDLHLFPFSPAHDG